MRLPRHHRPPARPTAQRRTLGARGATVEAEAPPPVRRTNLTSRAALLAVALCAVLLTLAVPLQQYVAQRNEIRELAAEERARTERVQQLVEARERWQDPAYIRQQARERLHFVEPGETAYVIVDPAQPSSTDPAPAAAAHEADDDGTWYAQLWSTVEVAGADPAELARATPSPAPKSPRPLGPNDNAKDKKR